jgi:hypothetical protein
MNIDVGNVPDDAYAFVTVEGVGSETRHRRNHRSQSFKNGRDG